MILLGLQHLPVLQIWLDIKVSLYPITNPLKLSVTIHSGRLLFFAGHQGMQRFSLVPLHSPSVPVMEIWFCSPEVPESAIHTWMNPLRSPRASTGTIPSPSYFFSKHTSLGDTKPGKILLKRISCTSTAPFHLHPPPTLHVTRQSPLTTPNNRQNGTDSNRCIDRARHDAPTSQEPQALLAVRSLP